LIGNFRAGSASMSKPASNAPLTASMLVSWNYLEMRSDISVGAKGGQ